MTQTATSDRPAGQHRQQDPQQPRVGASWWTGLARPRLAWWLCGSSLLLMAAGLGLLALSRHARFPPSMDPWDEQALVILQFLGAPILGGLIAARRRAEGKSVREIRRCLKRVIARQLFKLLERYDRSTVELLQVS